MAGNLGILILIGAFGFLSVPAHAFRTANFPAELRPRVAFWNDLSKLPVGGPIWLHAGDSIASGWATKTVLRERIQEAESVPLPRAGSIEDLTKMVPSPRFPWYGGSEIGHGFLGELDRSSSQPWNVITTALAGALITVTPSEDALGHLEGIPNPERVKLVTLTFGHNDLCSDVDATAPSHGLRDRLRRLKARFANARWIAWDVIDVVGVREATLARLEKLPPSLGRDRALTYCRQSWDERNCWTAGAKPELTRERREKLRTLFREEFGPLFSPESEVLARLDVLDAVAGDCFHPSRHAQGFIAEALGRFEQGR